MREHDVDEPRTRPRARALSTQVVSCQHEGGCAAKTEVRWSGGHMEEPPAGWWVTPGADRPLAVLCPAHGAGLVR